MSNMSATANRTVLDVSSLPDGAIDHRSPIWWGNTLLLLIETAMFAVAIASYFYLRMNFAQWPPPQTLGPVPEFHPVPDARYGTITLLLVLASAAAMIWADRAALRIEHRGAQLGTMFVNVLGIAAIVARCFEFGALKFRWDENAYASVVWTILVLHLLHLIIGTIEDALMSLWMLTHKLDATHARDVRVTAVYVYWIAGIWVPIYAIIYFSPYWF
jgi:cytochrome c oxidase subunit 3